MIQDTATRFWSKVAIDESTPSACWNWTACKLPSGYGRFGVVGNRIKLAHRMAYELTYGPIGEGMVIDHRCHNPGCVRPTHLRQVTNKQNIENRRGANINSPTGVRGVTRHRRAYRARVKHNGVAVYGESFATLDEATKAVKQARLRIFTHSDSR